MKWFSLASLAQGIIVALSPIAVAYEPSDSCFNPERLTALCHQMKHLRSHVFLLDGQRELMQINFPYLEAVGQSMENLTSQMLITRRDNVHLEGLSDVQNLAKSLVEQARDKDPQALASANAMRSACESCHRPQREVAETPAQDIFADDWDARTQRCNESGHNPFLCKNMHALSFDLDFFHTTQLTGHIDYDLIAWNAKEMVRIARLLQALGPRVHPSGNEPLVELEKKANALIPLAQAEDPAVFQKSADITDTCQSCHGAP